MSKNTAENRSSIAFYGLILFLIFLLFQPQLYVPIFQKIKANYLVFLISFILAIGGGWHLLKSKQTFLLTGLFIIAVISIIASPLLDKESVIVSVNELIQGIALFLLVIMTIRTGEDLSKFCWCLVVFSFIIGVTSLVALKLGVPPLHVSAGYGKSRVFKDMRLMNFFGGFGKDPNYFGLLFILAFPISLGYFQKSRSRLKKIVLIFVTMLYFLCIFETKSRGTLLAAIVTFLFLLWEFKHKIKFLLVVFLITFLAGISATPEFWERASVLRSMQTATEEGTGRSRLREYGYAIELMSLYPITGIGIGNYISGKTYYLGVNPSLDVTYQTTHNSYLQIGAEIGVPGLLLFFILLGVSFHELAKSGKILKDNEKLKPKFDSINVIKIGYVGFLFGIIFLSMQYSPMLYLYIGLAVISRRIALMEINKLIEKKEYSKSVV